MTATRSRVHRLLVVGRPSDFGPRPYDGLVDRHMRMLEVLADDYELTLLCWRLDGDQSPHPWHVPARRHLEVAQRAAPGTRAARLMAALDAARGATPGISALARLLASDGPEVALTIGPWVGTAYRTVFALLPTVHLFEEDMTQMPENASQSRQARVYRQLEAALHSQAPAQPSIVVAMNTHEQRRAAQWFPRGEPVTIPFTLDPERWGDPRKRPTGRWVLAVGNFAEPRNAEGLAEVVAEVERRRLGLTIEIRVVSGPGLHPLLVPWHRGGHLAYDPADVDRSLPSLYAEAWAALVPATRATGQKTTILQAWACRCPVVASEPAARTVDAIGAAAVGADPAELVVWLERLRNDQAELDRLAESGRRALTTRFDDASASAALRGAIDAAYHVFWSSPGRRVLDSFTR